MNCELYTCSYSVTWGKLTYKPQQGYLFIAAKYESTRLSRGKKFLCGRFSLMKHWLVKALPWSVPLMKSDLSYTGKTGAIQTGFLANWEARISLDDIYSSVIDIYKRNPCQAPTGLIHQKYTFLTWQLQVKVVKHTKASRLTCRMFWQGLYRLLIRVLLCIYVIKSKPSASCYISYRLTAVNLCLRAKLKIFA